MPEILHPQDAIVRVTRSCICGSDLHLYNGFVPSMEKGDVIARFISVIGKRAEHSKGEARICAAVLDIDEDSGRARSLERLNLAHEQ